MSDTRYLAWPFFEERHRALARELDAWATDNLPHDHSADVDTECRSLVRSLGGAGWLAHAVGGSCETGSLTTDKTKNTSLK